MKSDYLQQWLEIIYQYGKGQCVIVTGGGIFADFVRSTQEQWQFDDHVAHQMALCAMDQFAYYCQSLQPQLVLASSLTEIKRDLANKRIPICLASSIFKDTNLLKPDWTVTSDSIAACLANQLEADMLVLVKSVQSELPRAEPAALAKEGIVDQAFPDYCRTKQYTFHCLAADETNKLQSIL